MGLELAFPSGASTHYKPIFCNEMPHISHAVEKLILMCWVEGPGEGELQGAPVYCFALGPPILLRQPWRVFLRNDMTFTRPFWSILCLLD